MEYNTVTKTTMKLERRLTLPALTICNYNLITNDSVKDPRTRQLLQEYYAEDTKMDVIENLGDEFLETFSLRDLLIKGSPQVQRTFSLCWVFNDIVSCYKLLRRKKTENGYCFIFGSKEHNKTIQTQLTGVEGGVSFLLWLDQDNYFIGDGFSAGVKVGFH